MAINPFRIGELQLPQPVKTQAIDFSPLQNLGAGIGAYRRQQDIGSILAGATDANGNLDVMRAASELGKRGYVKEADDFIQNAIRQQAVKQTGAHQATTERRLDAAATEAARHNVATETGQAEARAEAVRRAEALERLQRDQFEQGRVQRHVIPGKDPYTDEDTTRIIETGPSGPKQVWPLEPAPAVVPPATLGPRSEAPMPGSFAEDPARMPPAAMQRVAALGGLPTPDTPPTADVPPPTRVAQAAPAPARGEPGGLPLRPGEPGGPPMRPNIAEARKELGKKTVDLQLERVKNAETAAELKPYLDDVVNTWEALQQARTLGRASGIGPIVASSPWRAISSVLGTNEEALRQRYDTAIGTLKARIVPMQQKGTGALSNYERQLAAMQFPELTASKPESQLAFLKQIQATTNQTLEGGRETLFGTTPGVVLDRPAMAPGEKPKPAETRAVPAFNEQDLAGYRASSAAALSAAKAALQRGKLSRKEIEEVLRQINPELIDKLGK